jgi:hypothetical protein
MVLTKPELIASLQNEVRILLHLASKLDRSQLDYRPTPKQRSPIELLRYLTLMGPFLVQCALTGKFDQDSWMPAIEAANARGLDETVAEIAKHKDLYATLLANVSDAELREEIDMFGSKTTRGAFIVNLVLCGCAAYRTQLFLYLKSCGHEELGTMNLWQGMDAPVAAV